MGGFDSSVIFLCLLCTPVINSAYIPCEDCDDRVTPEQLANISLRLYPGKTLDEFTSVPIGNAVSLLEGMNLGKPTVFYIHGWTESPESQSISLVLSAYLERQDHNVVLLDYQEIAAADYITAIRSAEPVGITVATELNILVAAGLNPDTLHIVSHSLGSHIAGFIGRNVDFGLARISALDPAGPGFNALIPSLTSDDAKFVDVILTDGGLYGNHLVRGTVTFYPNGGRRIQPGCPNITAPLSEEAFCSHHRSWRYYAESVRDENAFVGLECSSFIAYRRGLCRSNKRVVMGYGTPTTASGRVYLETNSESPFGRGDDFETYA